MVESSLEGQTAKSYPARNRLAAEGKQGGQGATGRIIYQIDSTTMYMVQLYLIFPALQPK